MSRRLLALITLALVAGLLGASGPGFSAAVFTSSSTSTATVQAATDWTPPTVLLRSPGSTARGSVTLTAEAEDGESGVAAVAMQIRAGGGDWRTACTVDTAPYTCAWDTTAVPDGTYDLRAQATDGAGYSAVSASVRTTVDNQLVVILDEPAEIVRASVALRARIEGSDGTGYAVRIEATPAGTDSWSTVCIASSGPWTCAWGTTAYADGDYDLRAVATTDGAEVTSDVVPDILVDNQAPAVTMSDPGSPLSGTRTFAATASDGHSGIASVSLQYASHGSSTWTEFCTIPKAPFSCRVDTAQVPDGTYSWRAVATDEAGNSTTSAVIAGRVVDNTVSTVSLQDPGALLSGSVTLRATASSTAGVTRVRIQRAPAGGSAWTDLCADNTAPYTCTWDTSTVAAGDYDLRAVLRDGTGAETVSEVVRARRVDNTPLKSHDIQGVNGGGTPGRPDAGDAVTFTWTGKVDLSTVRSGWSGGSVPVQVRLRDGNDVGGNKKDDVFDVWSTSGVVRLGSVNLGEDYVKSKREVILNGTMTATTMIVAGKSATQVTVVLGSAVSGGEDLNTTTESATMTWTPASGVRDESGRPVSTTVVSESGSADRNF